MAEIEKNATEYQFELKELEFKNENFEIKVAGLELRYKCSEKLSIEVLKAIKPLIEGIVDNSK